MAIKIFKSLVNPNGYASLPISGANEAQKQTSDKEVTICDFSGKDAFSCAGREAAIPTSQTAEVPFYASAEDYLRARGFKKS